MNNLNFSYDEYRDWLTVEGVNYSGDLFRVFGNGGLALFEPFEIIKRADGVVTIRRLASESNCTWTYDEHHDKWDTACGDAWQFMDGTPVTNNVRFCPLCGRSLSGGRA